MTTTTHTPTPWKYDDRADINCIYRANPVLGEVWRIVENRDRGDPSEDFAFIVTACNAHDELVAALREVSGQLRTIQLDHKERWSNERVNMTSAFLLMADRALAKVGAP